MSVCITSTVGSALFMSNIQLYEQSNALNLIFCSCIWYLFSYSYICNHIHKKYVHFTSMVTQTTVTGQKHIYLGMHTCHNKTGGFCKVAHKLDRKTSTANQDDMLLCSQHTVLQQVPQHHV